MKSLQLLATVLFMVLIQAGCNRAESTGDDCDRYVRSLNRPEIMKKLEDWYTHLPKSYQATNLDRGSGSYPGIGTYTIPLELDPVSIGLNKSTEARVSLNGDGRITEAFITDARGVMFAFKIDGDENSFMQVTLQEPRGNLVGIVCLRK